MMQADKGRRYSFGDFTLDVDRGALLSGDSEVRLRRQSFQVLRYLVENHGRLVSRDELQQAIWGNTIVTDGSLTQCLIDVRRALGDRSRRLIRTVPRRGYLFDTPVIGPTAPPGTPATTTNAVSRRLPIALATAFVVAAVTILVALRMDPSDATAPPAQANSIAVLPFVDMSETQDQEYFSDGIADEILNTLARSPDLHVIARTSSFSFKGTGADITTIADALDVAYVLEGSVRRSGDRVRISAQLVDATTSTRLWSETYDRNLTDVIEVQTGIAAAVAQALQVRLGEAPEKPASTEALELYLQGRFLHTRRSPGDSTRAEGYYRRALALDPGFGRAWSGLAGAHIVQIMDEGKDAAAAWAAWREAVENALEHAPMFPETHVRAAQYYWSTGDTAKAAKHRRRAMELGPANPLVLASAAGVNAFNGRLDLAIRQQQRAVELNPLSAVDHVNFANMLVAAGRLGEALTEERKALALNPSYAPQFAMAAASILILQARTGEALDTLLALPDSRERHARLAMAQHALGREAESHAALESLASRPGSDVPRLVAEVHAFRGETDEAYAMLERGRAEIRNDTRAERSQWVHDTRLSPFLASLRGDPRWDAVVAWED